MEGMPERLRGQPEHVELVRHEINDGGQLVEAEFEFARRMTPFQMGNLLTDRDSALSQILRQTFEKKGWIEPGEDPALIEPFDQQMSPDGKSWVFLYANDAARDEGE